MSFFGGIKTAAKDVGKVAKETGKVSLDVTEIAAPVAASIVMPAAAPAVEMAVTKLSQIHNGVETDMNPLEAMAITIVLGTLQTVIKNPAHKTLLENQLVGLANQIYAEYGMTPPAQPTAEK